MKTRIDLVGKGVRQLVLEEDDVPFGVQGGRGVRMAVRVRGEGQRLWVGEVRVA